MWRVVGVRVGLPRHDMEVEVVPRSTLNLRCGQLIDLKTKCYKDRHGLEHKKNGIFLPFSLLVVFE